MGEDFVDMEIFGKKREAWLKTFLELPNGIPYSDTFRHMFERLDLKELSEYLNHWLENTRDLNAIGMVRPTLKKGIVRTDTRHFIMSVSDVNDFAYAVKKH